jgi:hypothetical protein
VELSLDSKVVILPFSVQLIQKNVPTNAYVLNSWVPMLQ